MEIKISISSRAGRATAKGIYTGKETIVKVGGTISEDFAEHIQGGKKAKSYRDNLEYVNNNGVIIKDCVFSSPSTAAQFVTGRSTNGYEAWKVDGKKSLGEFLKEEGLR
ncbi:MAG: DUF4357 domain-containing protein [Blautia sp.]|nr:DUF4357 domain-containing protein [Blautia sp.]